MQTGEDIQALRKIIDFTRLISITILSIHIYMCCYQFFDQLGWTATIINKLILNIAKTGLFDGMLRSKLAAIICLAIALVAAKGKKEEKINGKSIAAYLLCGLLLYFLSTGCLYLPIGMAWRATGYIVVTASGYLLIMTGGNLLSRLIKIGLNNDIFNNDNETFPQEERLLENEYSINLPARYSFKGELRNSYINVINPFRGLLVSGTPGAGKSYFVIRHIIQQHIRKGFSIFLYDFKFDDLTQIAYNNLLKYQENYKVKPKFYIINFDDLNKTHRCNPLDPESMMDLTDAMEAARTMLLGLNRTWIKKQGDFFIESPINFLTAVIWYLKKYRDGKYCTLPHVIELMQAEYDHLFPILREEQEIKVLMGPFISAYQNKAKEQLEGQIASAKISLARLSSPQLYYVLSGNDFTLDINNPEAPKIICAGNNPQKQQVYGAVLSLYISRMIKLVNRKGQLKSSLIFDEFPSIFLNGIDGLLATSRSNFVSTTLAVQNYEQIKKDYGAEQSDVIVNIVGNIISGQVTGETAKKLSDNFGKIMQDRNSLSINSSDTSASRSTQLEAAIPASKIAALSSGEFVGIVADNPEEKITLKMFHCEVQNDHEAIKIEDEQAKQIPVVKKISPAEVQENYQKIKREVDHLIQDALAPLLERQRLKEAEENKEVE